MARKVENMLLGEWNMDDALAVAREESREEGRNERNEELLALLDSGASLAEVRKILSTAH